MSEAPELSVVIPIFNEQEILAELFRRLRRTLEGMGISYEMVFVDDGSTDESERLLEAMVNEEPRVRVVQLARNFGLHMAVSAGIDHASGNAVALMDGDLQDSPEDLPRLVAALQEGYDVAYAVRIKRKESAVKRAVVFAFYRFLSQLAATRIPVDSGLFCVMRRPVVDALARLPERSRYLCGLRAWVGFRQKGVPIERAVRLAGSPRQSMRRLVRLALDALFSFSYVPLRLATYMGFGVALLATGGIVWAVWLRYFGGQPPAGWTSTILIILFIGGIQLVALGIIGEYLGRIYDEVKARPLYLVRQRLGFQQPAGVRD